MGIFDKRYYTMQECMEDANRSDLSLGEKKNLLNTAVREFLDLANAKMPALKNAFQDEYEHMIKETNIGDLSFEEITSRLEDPNDPTFKTFKMKYIRSLDSFCEKREATYVQDSSNRFNNCIVPQEFAKANCQTITEAFIVFMEDILRLHTEEVVPELRHVLYQDVNSGTGSLHSNNTTVILNHVIAYFDAYEFIEHSEMTIKSGIVKLHQFVDDVRAFKQNNYPTFDMYCEMCRELEESGADAKDFSQGIIDNTKEQYNQLSLTDTSSPFYALQVELVEAFQSMCSEALILDLELEQVEDFLEDVSDEEFTQFKHRHARFVDAFCDTHHCEVRPHPFAPVGYCLMLRTFENVSPRADSQTIIDAVFKSGAVVEAWAMTSPDKQSSESKEDKQQFTELVLKRSIDRIHEFVDIVRANFYKLSPSADDVLAFINENK